MTPRMTWTVAIVALLAANMIAMITLAVIANRGGAQVIPDYYAKAVHYDDALARSAASHALGWNVAVVVAGGTIDATVSDASGAPIDGAEVRITGYQRAHASDVVDVVLASASAGRYRGAIRDQRGWYDLEASVAADGARYTQHVVIEAR